VVVTGAASELGAVYCRELSAAGYTVVGADVEAVAEVDLGVPVDVTDRASTERLAEDGLERFGRSTRSSTTRPSTARSSGGRSRRSPTTNGTVCWTSTSREPGCARGRWRPRCDGSGAARRQHG
jgi:NAD(P)-dependent dehydrogenase (short-subunit alcohol dehydrogenase family)